MLGILVLPGANDDPASGGELAVGVPIAELIGDDLGHPETPIGTRGGPVERAAVPEATIDEHCDPLAGECDVGAATERRYHRSVDAEAETGTVKEPADGELRPGIAPALGFHAALGVG